MDELVRDIYFKNCLAQFTTETEYVMTTEVAKEVIWIDIFISEMRSKDEVINVIYDSQSVIYFATNIIKVL